MTNIATTHIKEEQKLKGNRNKEKKNTQNQTAIRSGK